MANVKYSEEQLVEAVKEAKSLADVLRFLDMKVVGGNQTYMRTRLDRLGIDTSHFTGQGHQKGKTAPNKKTASEILVMLPEGSYRPKVDQLRRAMIESGLEKKCPCGITDEWNGKPIQLEVDHIDGNWYNNYIENLRFICPNCHSQEPTNRSWKNK